MIRAKAQMKPRTSIWMATGMATKIHKQDHATVSSSSLTVCRARPFGMMLYTRIYWETSADSTSTTSQLRLTILEWNVDRSKMSWKFVLQSMSSWKILINLLKAKEWAKKNLFLFLVLLFTLNICSKHVTLIFQKKMLWFLGRRWSISGRRKLGRLSESTTICTASA